MNRNLDFKRIFLFLAFAFGIAWITAGYIYFNGGLSESPEKYPGSGITIAFVLIATVYMFAPAVLMSLIINSLFLLLAKN